MSRLYARIGTFRQLEIWLAVFSHGSITQASKALHLTQPTVSMQLKKLSEALDAPLYHAVGRKLVFTDEGIALAKSAREVLGAIDHLDMRLADMKGLKVGRLRIAVVTTAKYFIPHLLGEFLQQYPDIDVDFKVGNRQQIIERMETGEDDFYVFSHPPKGESIALHEFLSNPLVPIVPEDHPLASQPRVSLNDFLSQRFLMREQGSGTRHAIERHLETLGANIDSRMTIESNEAIKHAVMSGLGVSILSSHTLAFGGSAGLAQLEVEHLPIMTKWYLANLSAKEPSVVAKAFLDYVTENNLDRVIRD